MSEEEMKAIYIQWKGTDVCCDIYCPKCKTNYHYDGYFLYSFKCMKCGSVYKLPMELDIKKINKKDIFYENAIELGEENE